jgi:NADH-ubiquinone oxidoreductase chain 5
MSAGIFGTIIGKYGSKKITTFLIGVNLMQILFLCYTVFICKKIYLLDFGNWINNDLLNIGWIFLIDSLTLAMLIVVCGVSFFVHLYSIDYMSNDPHISRFMSYLSLFTFFMIILVIGDNFILLFLGWEGVGLCSYLLISFWFTRLQANKAAIKALVVNRISDFILTIGIISLFFLFKSLNFSTVFALVPLYSNETFFFLGQNLNMVSTISLLIFIGAMGKSAQIGLHTWLPDAMEGPTPVSALIHAATMVTAGVFLLIKSSVIFEFAPKILVFVTCIGALTAFFASTIGLVQNDIKKVIAYSTCSQLGYMVFACGLSNYPIALFHLSNHAFFKALLFLSAGAIIHSMSNEQDMRKYGGLINLLPYTSTMLLIGSLSLMGLPFLSGFYSKDLILEIAYSKYTVSGLVCYWLGVLTAFFTSIYSFRLFYLTFIYKTNSFKALIKKTHELPVNMYITLTILSICSIFCGYMIKDSFVGLGTNFWNQNIFILPSHNDLYDAEVLPHIVKMLPFFGSIFAICLINYFFFNNVLWRDILNNNFQNLYRFLSYKWYFDVIYNKFINVPIIKFCYNIIFKVIDKGILEHSGPYFFSNMIYIFSIKIKQMQTGYIYRYGYFILYFFITSVILTDIYL